MDSKKHRDQRGGGLRGCPNEGNPRSSREGGLREVPPPPGRKTPRGETSGPLGPHSGQVPPEGGGGEQGLCHEVPSKSGGKLKKARALRKRLQAKKMHKKGEMAAKEEGGSPEPLVTKETRDTAATGPTEPSELGHAERAQDQRGERLPHATSEASVREVTPPDWGDEEEDSNPEVPDQEGTAQWPWGPAGRPSDQEEGQRKPNEPTGKPPRQPARGAARGPRREDSDQGEQTTVNLVPNLRSQVRQVQEYMARWRGDRAS